MWIVCGLSERTSQQINRGRARLPLATSLIGQEGMGGLERIAATIQSENSWSVILSNAARSKQIAPSDMEAFLPVIEGLSPYNQSRVSHSLFPNESDPERLRQFASALAGTPEDSGFEQV